MPTPRPRDAICQNCVLWDMPTTECRRDAPQRADGPRGWPKTKATDWCGGFNDDWDDWKAD